MSRPLRIEYENAYYHVMNRGRGRQPIFHGEAYYDAFLGTLAEAYGRFGLEIHAYCLMTNHYHLLVKTPEANLTRAMRHIGGVYTQRYNRLKKTDGALFRGRYKAIVVDSDAYLLHLTRYIHRNPLAAKGVDRLDDFTWSSYRAYVGQVTPPQWLHRDETYGQLQIRRGRTQKYRRFVENGEENEALEPYYNTRRWKPILGDDVFIQMIRKHVDESANEVTRHDTEPLRPCIEQIVAEVAKQFSVAETTLYQMRRGRGQKNTPRKIAMFIARNKGGHTLVTIAKAFITLWRCVQCNQQCGNGNAGG